MSITFQRHEHGAWCHPAADGCPEEILAPGLTPAEAATLARIDAAPPAPESYACTCGHEGLTAEWHADTCGREEVEDDVVERVARALMRVTMGFTGSDGGPNWACRQAAAAAIAAMHR